MTDTTPPLPPHLACWSGILPDEQLYSGWAAEQAPPEADDQADADEADAAPTDAEDAA
jgi:hypothetical protein